MTAGGVPLWDSVVGAGFCVLELQLNCAEQLFMECQTRTLSCGRFKLSVCNCSLRLGLG